MPNWKKVIVSGSIAKLANETFISGHITASGTVKAEHFISTDDALIGDDLVVNGDIDLDGSIDVNGTANLDIVDIDGAVDMASTALVTGVLTTTAAQVVNGGISVATNKKLIFRDSAIHISSTADGDLSIAADDEIDITSTLIDINGNADISGTLALAGDTTIAIGNKLIFRDSAIHISSVNDGDLMIVADDEIDITSTLIDINGNLDVSGTALVTGVLTSTAIQVVNGGLALATDKKVQFRDSAIHINSNSDGTLQFVADTALSFVIGSTSQVLVGNGFIMPTATNDIDLGTKANKFKDLFLTGDITASGHMHIVGDITSSQTIKADAGIIVAENLTVGGDIDLNGAIDVATTALVTGVLTSTAIQVVNGGLALATDKKIQFRDSAIFINSDADANLQLVSDTNIVFKIGSTDQFKLEDGAILPTTTNDIDLGTASRKFKDLFLTGDITASGHMHVVGDITASGIVTANEVHAETLFNHAGDANTGIQFASDTVKIQGNDVVAATFASNRVQFFKPVSASSNMHVVGDITSSAIIKAEHFISTDDALIGDDLVVNGDIDLDGSIDVNGTANLDIVDIDGAVNMATTALVTGVLTTTAAQVSNGGLAVATNKKLIFRDSAIHISSPADGDMHIAADDEIDITSTLIDINGNVDISGTALVTGVLTSTAIQVVNGGLAVATNKKVQFRDSAIYVASSTDGQLDIVADDEVQIATSGVDLNGNLDVSGTTLITGVLTSTAIQVVNGGLALATNKKVQFRDSAIYLNSSADGQLDIVADTEIQIAATTIDINGAVVASANITAASLTLGQGTHLIADGSEITDSSENTIIEFADDAITFSAGSTTINGTTTIAKRKWARTSSTNNNLTQGDITFTGGEGTIALGDIVYMDTSGNWQRAQANSLTKSKGILGIALGNNAGVNGILLRGMFTLDHDVGNNQGIPLFLSDATAGQAIIAAPDTSGDVVRIIGYNLGNDDQIWFSPDNTFVEVA